MAASVGGQACEFVRGTAPRLKMRTRTWQVPGLHGYGAQRLGLGDSRTRFVAVKFGTAGTIDTWLMLIEAMQGSVITVVNNWPLTFTNFLLCHVSQPRLSASLNYGGRCEVDLEGLIVA